MSTKYPRDLQRTETVLLRSPVLSFFSFFVPFSLYLSVIPWFMLRLETLRDEDRRSMNRAYKVTITVIDNLFPEIIESFLDTLL